jgi:hypothetical protein
MAFFRAAGGHASEGAEEFDDIHGWGDGGNYACFPALDSGFEAQHLFAHEHSPRLQDRYSGRVSEKMAMEAVG